MPRHPDFVPGCMICETVRDYLDVLTASVELGLQTTVPVESRDAYRPLLLALVATRTVLTAVEQDPNWARVGLNLVEHMTAEEGDVGFEEAAEGLREKLSLEGAYPNA